MPIIAKDNGGADIAPVPAGTYHAICYAVVDVGTQPGGQFEPHRKVIIIFELPSERATFEKDGKKEDKPRAISKEYTLSIGKKAKLRADLESWRGRAFTEEELKGFDLKKLVCANALVSVGHKAGSGKNANRVFAEIKSVAGLPKPPPPVNGVEQPNQFARRTPENEPLYYSLDDTPPGTLPEFPKNMPQWIQDKIKESEEYRKMEKAVNGTPTPTTTAGAGAQKVDDGAPF